eukprot:TRINITY_DN1209_c0_g1_i2.p1 TRINITY_DN1209_c0_g1~~TRINITY_DN1209_c0_g1_i2.p1  ORF type:complete len:269 (-),score=56.52 TRINITY_DN1209_c0_g1_i2:66-872(-)
MRSVEKFMPWHNNIWLVTNGQIPDWANTSAPHFKVITHKEIFPDEDDLPTFNSNAIEAHLHKIPGLAPCFIYFNDDMFLAHPIAKEMFIDPDTGFQRLLMSSGYVAPMPEKMKTNLWHRSVGNSNEIISSYYYPGKDDTRHPYVGHVCYFMRKDILDLMYSRWQPYFDATSHHKFRQGDDVAVPFMHANVAMEEFGATRSDVIQGMYGTWTPNKSKNSDFWRRLWRTKPHCACMNDGLDSSNDSQLETKRLQVLFSEQLPVPSRVEKR